MDYQKFTADLLEEMTGYYDEFIALLPKLLMAIILVSILSFLLRFIRLRLISFIMKRADDKLLVNFSGSIIKIVNIILLFFLFLVVIGQAAIAGSLFGAAGLSAFVIGFALKDIIENFLAGVIMAFNRPFRIMDTIEVNGITGNIIKMSLRETIVKTFDGKDVYIPNSIILKNPLYNYTIDGFLRQDFILGIDYDSNLPEVVQNIKDVLVSIPGILNNVKKPSITINSLGASAINLKIYYWINTFDKKYAVFELKNKAVELVINKLVHMGVGMPADIVELKNYTDEFKVATTKKSA